MRSVLILRRFQVQFSTLLYVAGAVHSVLIKGNNVLDLYYRDVLACRGVPMLGGASFVPGQRAPLGVGPGSKARKCQEES